MTRGLKSILLLSVAIAVTAVAQSEGNAQSLRERLSNAVNKLEIGCGEDVRRFCGSVTPGEGRTLLCIMAHEDQVSRKCDLTLYDASRNLDRALDRVERLADACWADIERSCTNAPEGGARITQCLAARGDLSPACQSAVAETRSVRSVGEAPAAK